MPEWSWWSWIVGAVCGVGIMWVLVVVDQARQQDAEERERGHWR